LKEHSTELISSCKILLNKTYSIICDEAYFNKFHDQKTLM